MAGVSFALADFRSGGPILDLPIMEGASWSAQLNRADSLTCKIDMRDDDVKRLDLRSSTEPKKTVLVARTDDDVILAWGLINEREWDEDKSTVTLNASGVLASYFGRTRIMPATALTAPLTVLDAEGYSVINPALDTKLTGWSLGTIAKKLVAQRLAWPGAPTAFILPADEVGIREREYLFSSLKPTGAAITDLTNVENGPDIAFEAQRASDGISLQYVMRHGSEANPRLGTAAGIWSLDGQSPITELKVKDDGDTVGSAAWLTAGKSAGTALVTRALNPSLITNGGYPPLDLVDTTHSDVSEQATLDSYGAELIRFGGTLEREVSFSVQADASPALGAYRPGDAIIIDVPSDHDYLVEDLKVRITSISGDEAGLKVKIGCVVYA